MAHSTSNGGHSATFDATALTSNPLLRVIQWNHWFQVPQSAGMRRQGNNVSSVGTNDRLGTIGSKSARPTSRPTNCATSAGHRWFTKFSVPVTVYHAHSVVAITQMSPSATTVGYQGRSGPSPPKRNGCHVFFLQRLPRRDVHSKEHIDFVSVALCQTVPIVKGNANHTKALTKNIRIIHLQRLPHRRCQIQG